MRTGPRNRCALLLPRGERGLGLMEVVVATLIATIAVIALAYSFGTGRGLVSRYELARVALAAAQRRMETLEAAPAGSPDLAVPSSHGPQAVLVAGQPICQESWAVAPFHDPANTQNPGHVDLRRVVVVVTWGGGTEAETLRLTRLFPAW
jgi:hypothetical protein